jgi:hypothetical protein
MRHLRNVTTLGVVLFAVLLALSAPGVRAHEQETFVDWEVGYANLNFLAAPVFIEQKNAIRHVGQVDAAGNYGTIPLNTGDVLVVNYSFRYLGLKERRGDLGWTTRLGLDFGTIGRYVDGKWIGGGSFALVPGQFYNATLVLRSLQPTLRHLHVSVSVQDVGNIVAAPTVIPIPAGGPIIYGIWTDANGPVVEPLAGFNVPPFGTLKLLEPWPWAVAGLVAQIVIGLSFIGIMYWYGKWESKRQSKGGAGA